MLRRTTSLAGALAALMAIAIPTQASAATRQATSSNWSGYAASRSGVTFRRVAGSWVQPPATCDTGARRYSAYWVGLGGLHSYSQALEQIGTEADCSSTGTARYSAWYELVPAAPVDVHLTVRPGDTLSASVTVTGKTVKLFLRNRTRGTSFTKTLTANRVDVTSAEWIVEAPSQCDARGCVTLPLANFGSASFAGANATTATGHTGTIADPTWSPVAITLASGRGRSFGGHFSPQDPSTGAAPSDLSPTGDAFTVTYGVTPQEDSGLVPTGGANGT